MKIFAIAAPFIWAAIVLFLHVMPIDIEQDPGLRIPHADKIVHFGMFGVLSFLLSRSHHYRHHKKTSLKAMIIIGVVCIAYGALMETLQSMTPAQRDSDLYDWFADIAGSVTGLVVAGSTFLPFLFKHQVRKSS